MELKPLDIVMALCVAKHQVGGLIGVNLIKLNTVRDYADFTGVSVGAVVASQKRLKSFGLISKVPDFMDSATPEKLNLNLQAFAEFLEYGVKYYSLPERNGYGVGRPTSWSCPIVKSEMLPPETNLVWEDPQGDVRGEYITPIHPSVVTVSRQDSQLYLIFSIIDAIRVGKPRELKIARKLLRQELGIEK